MRKLIALLLAVSCLVSLTACHGSRGMTAFSMPESFDESRQYEISFWAKNDTNLTQRASNEQAIPGSILMSSPILPPTRPPMYALPILTTLPPI